MMSKTKPFMAALALATALIGSAMTPAAAQEQEQGIKFNIPNINIPSVNVSVSKVSILPQLMPWMNAEIHDAWAEGYQGQGTTVTVIDNFSTGRLVGDLGIGLRAQTHGGWTSQEISMLAPRATLRLQDFSNTRAVSLASNRLNVLNLSYGMFATDGYADSQIGWGAREKSILTYANTGRAVVVKAAGNDGVDVGFGTSSGTKDYLGSGLIGAQSALFVGALDRNGSVDDLASITWYSNKAGQDTRVQDHFLMVGVESDETNLYGTSFAAPIVSGYAAVLGSKFTKASPTEITNRLLETARTDTISGYDRSVHGVGEASIARAMAPITIN